jgi:hypothetical protein
MKFLGQFSGRESKGDWSEIANIRDDFIFIYEKVLNIINT